MKYQLKQEERADARDKNMAAILADKSNQLKTMADTLKVITEALGVDAVMGRGAGNIVNEQIGLINNSQDRQ